jgi:hypothetical protein
VALAASIAMVQSGAAADLALQRQARAARHDHAEREADPASSPSRESVPVASWNFSKIPVFPPNHAADTEASTALAASRNPGLKPANSEHDPQTSSAAAVAPPASGARKALNIVYEVLRSPGQPLASTIRAEMEPRFGSDFSHVRIHTDEKAARSAAAVNAAAYTVGAHIVFPGGSRAPESVENRQMLAHELAHVMQSSSSLPNPLAALKIEPPMSKREVAARRGAHAALSGRQPGELLSKAASPAIFRQEVEAPSLEQVPPGQSGGVNLPAVSKEAADPRGDVDYIDKRVAAVGYGLYDGFLIFCGLSQPIKVPEYLMDFGQAKYESVSSEIHEDYGTAQKQIPLGPPAAGEALPYAYFRVGDTGIIAPTVFSPATAPRIVEAGWASVKELQRQVQTELVYLALSIIGAMAIRAIIGKLVKIGEEPPSENVLQLRQNAAEIASRLRQAGKPVKVNLAGAGEVPDAVNINNLSDQQAKGIPNLVRANVEDVGDILPADSVDAVISNNVVRGRVRWGPAAKGSLRILKPGGRISVAPYAGDLEAHLKEISSALQDAGFQQVRVLPESPLASRYVEGVKP